MEKMIIALVIIAIAAIVMLIKWPRFRAWIYLLRGIGNGTQISLSFYRRDL